MIVAILRVDVLLLRRSVVAVLSTDITKITNSLQYTSPTVTSDFPCAPCTYASRLRPVTQSAITTRHLSLWSTVTGGQEWGTKAKTKTTKT